MASFASPLVSPTELPEPAGPRHPVAGFGVRRQELLQRCVLVIAEVPVQVARERGCLKELRIVYYLLVGDHQIWLFTIFGKDEAADLTADQKRQLRRAIEAELRARDAARQKRRR